MLSLLLGQEIVVVVVSNFCIGRFCVGLWMVSIFLCWIGFNKVVWWWYVCVRLYFCLCFECFWLVVFWYDVIRCCVYIIGCGCGVCYCCVCLFVGETDSCGIDLIGSGMIFCLVRTVRSEIFCFCCVIGKILGFVVGRMWLVTECGICAWFGFGIVDCVCGCQYLFWGCGGWGYGGCRSCWSDLWCDGGFSLLIWYVGYGWMCFV